MLRIIIGALVLALTAPALADQPSHSFVADPANNSVSRIGIERRGHIADQRECVSRVGKRGARRKAVSGAAWYRLSDTFDLGVTADLDEDVRGLGVGIRIHFGK